MLYLFLTFSHQIISNNVYIRRVNRQNIAFLMVTNVNKHSSLTLYVSKCLHEDIMDRSAPPTHSRSQVTGRKGHNQLDTFFWHSISFCSVRQLLKIMLHHFGMKGIKCDFSFKFLSHFLKVAVIIFWTFNIRISFNKH